jgi:hypothetical protein
LNISLLFEDVTKQPLQFPFRVPFTKRLPLILISFAIVLGAGDIRGPAGNESDAPFAIVKFRNCKLLPVAIEFNIIEEFAPVKVTVLVPEALSWAMPVKVRFPPIPRLPDVKFSFVLVFKVKELIFTAVPRSKEG